MLREAGLDNKALSFEETGALRSALGAEGLTGEIRDDLFEHLRSFAWTAPAQAHEDGVDLESVWESVDERERVSLL